MWPKPPLNVWLSTQLNSLPRQTGHMQRLDRVLPTVDFSFGMLLRTQPPCFEEANGSAERYAQKRRQAGLWWLIFMVNLPVTLCGCFQKGLTEVGGPYLIYDVSSPRLNKKANVNGQSSLFPNDRCSVTSCLKLWFPWLSHHDELNPQTVSWKWAISSLRSVAGCFATATGMITP